jgi:hypothetical protein
MLLPGARCTDLTTDLTTDPVTDPDTDLATDPDAETDPDLFEPSATEVNLVVVCLPPTTSDFDLTRSGGYIPNNNSPQATKSFSLAWSLIMWTTNAFNDCLKVIAPEFLEQQ